MLRRCNIPIDYTKEAMKHILILHPCLLQLSMLQRHFYADVTAGAKKRATFNDKKPFSFRLVHFNFYPRHVIRRIRARIRQESR